MYLKIYIKMTIDHILGLLISILGVYIIIDSSINRDPKRLLERFIISKPVYGGILILLIGLSLFFGRITIIDLLDL